MSTDAQIPLLGNPSTIKTPKILTWLGHSRIAAVGWAAARIWLGIMWIQAGKDKLWGSENAAFLHHDGAGVHGFAAAGIKLATYSWWGHFLHAFVLPNSGWIGISISVAEFVIGVALVLGVLTPAFAFLGLGLNVVYMFSGTAGVNPAYAIVAAVLLLAWRTSGWIGADGILMGYLQNRHNHTATDQTATDRRGLIGTIRHAHTA